MPKSSKHKKARVADFAKAKLKLGKGKQIANNATNTSISSRSIALPQQSLSEAPKSEPVSRRNLTFPELLVQARHYSPSVKKEALTEITLLLASHHYLLGQHLLPLTSALSQLISDAVPSLRRQARELLNTIFEQLDEAKIATCSKGLLLFTLAALSSLDEGTRIDALKVLDLLMEFIPTEIVRGWDETSDQEEKGDLTDRGVGAKVVQGLLNVLRVRPAGLSVAQGGYTSAASGDLSPSSRLAILRTLSTFLTHALLSNSTSSNTAWYLAPSFLTPRAYASFLRSCEPSVPARNAHPLAFPPVAELHPLTSLHLLAATSLSSSSSVSAIAGSQPSTSKDTLLPLLHPTLLASFLDSAPAALGPTESSPQDLETVIAVLNVAKALYWSALGGGRSAQEEGAKEREERKTLVVLLTHVGAYFPFGRDRLEENRNAEVEQNLLDLNLIFASLVSLLVLSAPTNGNPILQPSTAAVSVRKPAKGVKKREKAVAQEGKIVTMVEGVKSWVAAALKGEHTTPSEPMGVQLSSPAFAALEPTIWALLNQPTSRSVDEDAISEEAVFEAVLAYFAGLPAGAEGKKQAFGFIARTVLIGSDPAYVDRYVVSEEEAQNPASPVAKWILSLSKFLWELDGKHPDTTEMVILFLHRLASQGSKGLFYPILSNLLPSLAPFFHLSHPKRGAIPGPWTKLPARVQLRALDLVFYLKGVSGDATKGEERLWDAVGQAVAGPAVAEAVKGRWEAIQSL